jgi:hypothetical protein
MLHISNVEGATLFRHCFYTFERNMIFLEIDFSYRHASKIRLFLLLEFLSFGVCKIIYFDVQQFERRKVTI